MTDPKCKDCGADTELGFVPDLSHSGVHQTSWHKGEAEESRIFGMKNGVKTDQREFVPIIAYRCSNCGVLRFYANASSKE
jgi:hypothetical protein